jgi:hypothetical protein
VAGATRVTKIAARAGVHCRDELECSWILRAASGARDGYLARLERLTQRFQHAPIELGQLVKKQHTMVREADFAGSRLRPAADHGRS